MQRLILFRHAKAERTSQTGEDFDRPLAQRGREDALLMGRVLAEAGFKPDLALVSAARRTIQTWEAAATAFPAARVEIIRNLFLADTATLLEAAESAAGRAETLMLVAHNPGLHDLALQLSRGTADPRLDRGFPTGAAAVFDVPEPGRYTLADVLLPGNHGGGAE
jgi:phosphohistidine phosphatase